MDHCVKPGDDDLVCTFADYGFSLIVQVREVSLSQSNCTLSMLLLDSVPPAIVTRS